MYPLFGMGDQEEEDPRAALVRELLSGIEAPTPPQAPPQPGTGRQIMGGLGDAILAMAAVRAGGAPPMMGPFAAMQREREQGFRQSQEKYQDRLDENRRAERALRVAVANGMIRKQPDPLEEARLKETERHNRATERRNEGRRRSRLVYDKAGNAFEQDLDTDEIRPIQLPTGEQARRPFTAAEVEVGTTSAVINEQLSSFEERAEAFASKKRTLGPVKSLGQTVIRGMGQAGQAVSEGYGDPDFEALAALRDRIGQQLARLVDSGRLSDQDREFALQTLPTVAALATEQGRQTFRQKIAIAREEINRRIAARERLRPGLAGETTERPSLDDLKREIDAVR